MYKVFINDAPVVLTDFLEPNTSGKVLDFKALHPNQIRNLLRDPNSQPLIVVCENLIKDWLKFLSWFQVVSAAGGKVINSKKEVLFIRRFGRWDLPKGHVEIGEGLQEAALREVKEECGIEVLRIVKELESTHHIYECNDQMHLKTTHWFLMHTPQVSHLKPQREEGIEQAVFKAPEEVSKALANTYKNIQLLF